MWTNLEKAIIEAIVHQMGGTPIWDSEGKQLAIGEDRQFWWPDQLVASFRENLRGKR